MVQILSVAALRQMNTRELEAHKKEVNKASLQAATDFDREAYINQLERINQILNETETTAEYLAHQEKRFVTLQKEIDQAIMLGESC